MRAPGPTVAGEAGLALRLKASAALPSTSTVTVLLVHPAGAGEPVQNSASDARAKLSIDVTPLGRPVASVDIWKVSAFDSPTARVLIVQLSVVPETDCEVPPAMLPAT